jgi:hypothetical protein
LDLYKSIFIIYLNIFQKYENVILPMHVFDSAVSKTDIEGEKLIIKVATNRKYFKSKIDRFQVSCTNSKLFYYQGRRRYHHGQDKYLSTGNHYCSLIIGV